MIILSADAYEERMKGVVDQIERAHMETMLDLMRRGFIRIWVDAAGAERVCITEKGMVAAKGTGSKEGGPR